MMPNAWDGGLKTVISEVQTFLERFASIADVIRMSHPFLSGFKHSTRICSIFNSCITYDRDFADNFSRIGSSVPMRMTSEVCETSQVVKCFAFQWISKVFQRHSLTKEINHLVSFPFQ